MVWGLPLRAYMLNLKLKQRWASGFGALAVRCLQGSGLEYKCEKVQVYRRSSLKALKP